MIRYRNEAKYDLESKERVFDHSAGVKSRAMDRSNKSGTDLDNLSQGLDVDMTKNIDLDDYYQKGINQLSYFNQKRKSTVVSKRHVLEKYRNLIENKKEDNTIYVVPKPSYLSEFVSKDRIDVFKRKIMKQYL